MRVTHVITRLVVGGAQENTLTTVRGLQTVPDLQASLISGPTTGAEGSLQPLAQRLGIDLTIVPSLVRPVHPFRDLLAYHQLTGLFIKQRPDIVHTHSGKAGVLGRLAAHKAGVPLIIHHIHGPSFGPFQGALANWVFRAAERKAAPVTTHFVCSAAAMSRRYLAEGIGRPDQYTRIFSGFDLAPFLAATSDPALRASLGLSPAAFVIGKLARLAPLKGHDDLLNALERLLPDCPAARLLFVGDGNRRHAVETRARAMGLEDKVVFTGLVPPEEVPRYLGIMDCLVHLSRREAVSRALPQAMAAGKPVIAYDFDGADEVCLEGQTGFLVETGHLNKVVSRLIELHRDRARRQQLGAQGREFVQQHFSAATLVERQVQLYRHLITERGTLT